jgi:hypothetical protein
MKIELGDGRGEVVLSAATQQQPRRKRRSCQGCCMGKVWARSQNRPKNKSQESLGAEICAGCS